MREIYLSYENGHIFKAYAVRYFQFRNNKYLIYTLNEIDQRNYMKLYVVKVMRELDTLVTQTVRRTDEWNLMKGLVKQILKELKKGKLSIISDLNMEELDKLVIYENRNFRLAKDLVNLLTQVTKSNVINISNKKDESKNKLTKKVIEEKIEVLDIFEEELPEVTEEILEISGDVNEEIEELEIFDESEGIELLDMQEEIEELEI